MPLVGLLIHAFTQLQWNMHTSETPKSKDLPVRHGATGPIEINLKKPYI